MASGKQYKKFICVNEDYHVEMITKDQKTFRK